MSQIDNFQPGSLPELAVDQDIEVLHPSELDIDDRSPQATSSIINKASTIFTTLLCQPYPVAPSVDTGRLNVNCILELTRLARLGRFDHLRLSQIH